MKTLKPLVPQVKFVQLWTVDGEESVGGFGAFKTKFTFLKLCAVKYVQL